LDSYETKQKKQTDELNKLEEEVNHDPK
jgi:hypothetical protein